MARALHLGAEGEEAAEHLLDVYDLSSIFEPCLLISSHSKALDEIRRRLAEKAARLEHLEPGEGLASRVQELAAKVAERDGRPVIWLQQKRFDPDRWSVALAALNQQRELFRNQTPWMWVLAGPPELVVIVHDKAMHVLTGISVRRTIRDEPRALVAAPSTPIRWFHLSDFHFQALERWDRRATLKALLRHAATLKDRGLTPEFVFITGDVAWSGQRQEYEQAERFFTELAETLGLEPREHFFLVPGNHDVDRGAIGPADGSIIDGLESQEAIERVLGDPRTMGFLARRLDAFYAFTERFLGAARGWRADRPWRVDVREVAGVEVGILQLNSAWASGHREERLLVGEAQARQALEEAGDAFLRIALVHHPIADLADVDRERLETLLGAPGGVHFLLRGHLHRSRAITNRTPDGQLTELAAGAVYTHGGYPKRYFLTETDLASGQARVHFFGFSTEGRGFWAPDTKAYEGARDGVWSFDLPRELKLDAEAAIPGTTRLSKARRATLTARYRAAAAAVHGTVRFVGFSGSRPRPNVQVSELFVPLRLRKRGRTERDEVWTTRELLRRLLDRSDEGQSACMVVLGDPGSGKTTLCKLAAVVVSGEHPMEGLEIEGEPLPLYLPFREYARRCREGGDCSIVAFLTDQARHHLQVPLPEPLLEEILDRGGAVLLLDGLDEVGSAAQREEMRERVQAFCRGYPRIPALVTSRVAGYHDAPLPQTGASAFRHLELDPFDREDLRLFVKQWYGRQEPEDPVARDRNIADLTAALETRRGVGDLARNPMLATLIALVHRYEARLPGERAALYDLCVRTFLETWPAARKRRFHEIDEGLQRAYLEALAYRMQRSRQSKFWGVTIGRQELVATLAEIVWERQDSAGLPEETRHLIERWVRFLEAGTGLLVEQRPGIFAFFHLSLMEYLAACGLEKAEEDLVGAIDSLYDHELWHEICLLAISSRATDKAFLDRLFDRLSRQGGRPQRWSFLLLALREEAAFDDRQRAAIVRGTARDFIDGFSSEAWNDDQRILDEVMRFSARHAHWARTWVGKELATAEGPELRAIVAIRRNSRELLDPLQGRSDRAIAAADLLDFWPGTPAGDWAVAAVEPTAALGWTQAAAPHELKTLRAIFALVPPGEHIAAALLTGLVQWAAHWRSRAGRWAGLLADRPRNGERGLPSVICIKKPGLSKLGVLPVWPTEANFGGNIANRPLFASELVRACTGTQLDSVDRLIHEVLPENATGILSSRYCPEFSAPSFGDAFPSDLATAFRNGIAGELLGEVARYLGTGFKVFGSPIEHIPVHSGEGSALALSDAEFAVPQLAPRPDHGPENKTWATATAYRLAAEAWIALVTTIDQPRNERAGYAQHRAQNAWLLHVWPVVDERLGEEPNADALALYLGLGWTQVTTTWQWPSTERWIALLNAEPPEHWLPRSQWHLCWLLHDRENEDHREALDEALEEGLADEDRPGVAASLQAVLFGVDE